MTLKAFNEARNKVIAKHQLRVFTHNGSPLEKLDAMNRELAPIERAMRDYEHRQLDLAEGLLDDAFAIWEGGKPSATGTLTATSAVTWRLSLAEQTYEALGWDLSERDRTRIDLIRAELKLMEYEANYPPLEDGDAYQGWECGYSYWVKEFGRLHWQLGEYKREDAIPVLMAARFPEVEAVPF